MKPNAGRLSMLTHALSITAVATEVHGLMTGMCRRTIAVVELRCETLVCHIVVVFSFPGKSGRAATECST